MNEKMKARWERRLKAGVITKEEFVKFTVRSLELPPVEEFSGDEIKDLREALSLSQALFADAVGAKRDTISKWERGDATPGKSFRRIFHTLKKYGLEAVY
jgi:DNA-binding transcriptional regulator YiaG